MRATSALADLRRVMNNGPAMLLDLDGKRAIVTGAATGIGRAIVQMLARHGVRTAVADRDLEGARTVAGEVGGRAQAYPVDVRSRDSVTACFSQIEQDFGGYDILCANAGVSSMAPVESLTDEDWEVNFAVNARGVFLTNQLAMPHFLAAEPPRGHRQHRLARRQGRRPLSGALLGQQVRRGRVHPGAGPRGGAQGHPRELPSAPASSAPPCRSGRSSGRRSSAARPPKRCISEYVAQTPLGPPRGARGRRQGRRSSSPPTWRSFITGEAINVTGGVRMD